MAQDLLTALALGAAGTILVPPFVLPTPSGAPATDIEFDMPQGPATPMLMNALERGHTVNATIRFFHNRRDGQEEKYMEIVCTDGRLAGVKVINQTRSLSEGQQIVHASPAAASPPRNGSPRCAPGRGPSG